MSVSIPSANLSTSQLLQYIERIESLEEGKRALTSGIREVHSEACTNGLYPKLMCQIVKMWELDKGVLVKQDILLPTYCAAASPVEILELKQDF